VPTVKKHLDGGEIQEFMPYQGEKSCFFMAKETSGFIQSELNRKRDISRILDNFSEHGVYRVIDKVKKDMPKPDEWDDLLAEEYNDEDYNSFTTPSIKETIGKMKTDGNLKKENVKEILRKMLVFSHNKAISLETITKRLIACRRYLKRENKKYAKVFDNCCTELGAIGVESDGLKFRKKNYKDKETKNKLLEKTNTMLSEVNKEVNEREQRQI
jgi:hypothetical protein